MDGRADFHVPRRALSCPAVGAVQVPLLLTVHALVSFKAFHLLQPGSGEAALAPGFFTVPGSYKRRLLQDVMDKAAGRGAFGGYGGGYGGGEAEEEDDDWGMGPGGGGWFYGGDEGAEYMQDEGGADAAAAAEGACGVGGSSSGGAASPAPGSGSRGYRIGSGLDDAES